MSWVIDFGISTNEDAQKSDLSELPGPIGTHPFVCLTSYFCATQFYRDDMESLAYLIWYIMDADSMWWRNDMKQDTKQMISDLKSVVTNPCTPLVIARFIHNCRSLPQMFEDPDYTSFIWLVEQWQLRPGRMTRSQTKLQESLVSTKSPDKRKRRKQAGRVTTKRRHCDDSKQLVDPGNIYAYILLLLTALSGV